MNYLYIGILFLVVAVVLFIGTDYLIKVHKKPQSVSSYLWNAAYFLSIKRYQTALERLSSMEEEFALTPEEMCDACFKRADAYHGLHEPEHALEAYELAYECLTQTDRPLKRNDALLEEIKSCYQKCDRSADFSKWDQLFEAITIA